MRRLWLRWPTFLAVAFFLLNVDLVVMPGLTWADVRGWWLFWAAAFFATAEPCYWNWYAKWVVRNVKHSERARRTTQEFTEHGFLGRFKGMVYVARQFLEDAFNWFVEHARQHTATDAAGNRRIRDRVIGVIRSTHIVMTYPMMLGLGLMPLGWPIAIFIQRIFPVPGAFVVFLVANAVKTYLIGLAYLWLPWWAQIIVFATAVIFLGVSVRKVVRKVGTLKSLDSEGPP